MGFTSFLSARACELVVVGFCLACCTLAYPTKSHSGESQRGVIPLGLVMSQLQVDAPDYHSEPLSPNRFTSVNKRRRHEHGNGYRSAPIHSEETDFSGSCCPTVEEIVEPIGGKSKSGHLVELFQNEESPQQIHEISCAPSVAERPCRFVNQTFSGQSRCVQQYSYSYALVRDFGSSGWRFEHIRVRSGCACIISPT